MTAKKSPAGNKMRNDRPQTVIPLQYAPKTTQQTDGALVRKKYNYAIAKALLPKARLALTKLPGDLINENHSYRRRH